MPLRHPIFATAAAVALLAGCGIEGSIVFGEQSGACPATVLTNDFDDAQKVDDGSACFLEEVAARRAVVWDVLVPTVEGDPILTRYDFDGDVTIITTDASRDRFGSGGVIVKRCQGIRPTNHLPEGIDCTGTSGDGFRSDSLPAG